MLASSGDSGEPCGVPVSVSETGTHPRTPRPQPTPQQLQQPPVDDPAFDLRHQGVVVDVVEARFDVSVEYPHPARVRCPADSFEGLMCRPFRSEPETHRLEVGFEDRLEHNLRRCHHHPVSHSRDAQRAGLTRLARLRDVNSPQRLGRYGPALSCPASSSRKARTDSTPPAEMSAMVTPSTPGAPRLVATSTQPATSRRCGRPCRRGHGTDVCRPAWHCDRARVGELERGPSRRPV